jgi:hypothetical protein
MLFYFIKKIDDNILDWFKLIQVHFQNSRLKSWIYSGLIKKNLFYILLYDTKNRHPEESDWINFNQKIINGWIEIALANIIKKNTMILLKNKVKPELYLIK